MLDQEIKNSWLQHLEMKLPAIMKSRFSEMMQSCESDITEVLKECNVPEDKNIEVEFKLNIDIIIPVPSEGNTVQKLKVETVLLEKSQVGGCVYYSHCPNDIHVPCVICPP